jgi:hypothetical protein
MSKKVISGFRAMDAVAVSSTTVYTSAVSDITFLDNASYVINVDSGTPSGTFTVQVSNDGIVYNPLTLSASPTITSGVLTNVPVSLPNLPFTKIKLVYTNSAGSGVVSAIFTAKEI